MKTVILLCALGLLIGCYFVIGALNDRNAAVTTETKAAAALSDRGAEEMTALGWSADEGALRFTRDSSGWHYDADRTYPVNQDTLNGLADKLAALTADRVLENAGDRSVYGLTDSAFTLTAEWADGTKTVYTSGAETAFADGWYVSRSGDDRVYITASSLKTEFNESLKSLAVNETIPSAEKISRVTTGAVDAAYAETSRTVNTDMHWYAADGTALDGQAVEDLIAQIRDISWNALVTGLASAEELNTYGLADGAVTLCLYDGDAAAVTLLIGASDGDGNCYARLPESKMVYTVSADSLKDILAATDASLKADATLLTLPYADVKEAVLTAGALEYTLKPGAAENAGAEDGEADAADGTDGEALWTAVTGIAPLGDAEARDGETLLTVRVTGVHGVGAEMVIRGYDAENYQASLDGGAPVLVSADKADRLIRMLKQLAPAS